MEKQWRKHILKVVLATRDSAPPRAKTSIASGFHPHPIGGIVGHVKRQTDQDEAVSKCGSFEIRFPDGRPSKYFYWDDLTVRLRPDLVASEVALEQAKALARAVREEHQSA